VRVIVLGAAAGGGVPQWNCGCPNCRAVREGRGRRRTQASLAISGDGEHWWLLGASPDLRAQIEAAPALHPRAARHSPIAGVALGNGDLDQCLGLFSLRESQPLVVYASPAVHAAVFERNEMARTFDRFPGQLVRRALHPGHPEALAGGLTLMPVAAPGKRPLHAPGPFRAEWNLGFLVQEGRRTIAWFPCVARPSPSVDAALRLADAFFFDGTFWSSDELARMGGGDRTAEEMGHWPLEQSLRFLASLPARRRYLVHVNNTNPVLGPGSPERRALTECGIGIPIDGEEVVLS